MITKFGRLTAVVAATLLFLMSASLSIGAGFLCGAGVGFVVFSILCLFMAIAVLLFARHVAHEIGDDDR